MASEEILICPYCLSEDTEINQDLETFEIFHSCNDCSFLWDGTKQWFE